MGQASPQPMVISTSAARTLSVVTGLGYSREMSRPISAIAWTTAGLSWSAGCDPAEVTWTRPAAWWSSSAAAIWDRPALWAQTNSTSGISAMLVCFSSQSASCNGPPARDRTDGDRQECAESVAAIWAAMNVGAETDTIPVHVSVRMRPMVTARPAKQVEDVNQYSMPVTSGRGTTPSAPPSLTDVDESQG